MICKWCNKTIDDKFFIHVNSNHHSNLKKYFQEFPEQKEEYNNTKAKVWNKGLISKDHPSVAKYANKIKEYSNQDEIRKERSERLKKRYENGDILTSEQRARVVQSGSDGWVKKLDSATLEERKALLSNFTSAGNETQNQNRHLLTPEDYQRLYPWAKGKFIYSNCNYCNNSIIICSGGTRNKPRAMTYFCDASCRKEYRHLYPNAFLGKKFIYYSSKMKKECFLMSRLEEFIAVILDKSEFINKWEICPHVIEYEHEGKIRKYYPDFLINDYLILEVKSDYVFGLDSGKTISKLAAAGKWCPKNGYLFEYWEFGIRNYTLEKIENDERVKRFLLGRN